MVDPQSRTLSRRHFLAAGGAAAGAVLLGACGSGDDDVTSGDATSTSDGGQLVLAQYISGPFHATGIPSRVPFGLADSEGLLPYKDTPEEIDLILVAPDGRRSAETITVRRHGQGLPRAYFPLVVTIGEPGIYTVRAELEGQAASEMAFEVKNPLEVAVVKPGDHMPGSLTPTTADARGVDPICTADPVCALHDITLTDALAEQRPIALLVATPAFCKVAACGPVHDVLLEVVDQHPDVRFLHAEVYQHPHVNPDGDFTQVLTDLRMFAEPSVFLVGSDGVVKNRLDSIYDADELTDALETLT